MVMDLYKNGLPIVATGPTNAFDVSLEKVLDQDPNFTNVSLLVRGYGANNSTSFTDESLNGFTVTAHGGAKISHGVLNPFGNDTGVVYLDGVNSYLSIEHHDALNLASANECTVEVFFYPLEITGGNQPLISKDYIENLTYMSYMLEIINTGKIRALVGSGNAGSAIHWYDTASTVMLNQWNHAVLAKHNGNDLVGLNGQLTSDVAHTMIDGGKPLLIGTAEGAGLFFKGYVFVRIRKNHCEYTGNYTVPVNEFPHQQNHVTVTLDKKTVDGTFETILIDDTTKTVLHSGTVTNGSNTINVTTTNPVIAVINPSTTDQPQAAK